MFGRKKRTIERLLVVEDEPLVAFDTEHLLREHDYVVVATVDRVADARAVIERGEAIDLVLVDVSLSDGSGIDVAKAAHARGIGVMFVTGDCPGEFKSLAQGCLAKPYSQRDLLAAIEVIDGVRAGRRPRKLPSGMSLFEKTES